MKTCGEILVHEESTSNQTTTKQDKGILHGRISTFRGVAGVAGGGAPLQCRARPLGASSPIIRFMLHSRPAWRGVSLLDRKGQRTNSRWRMADGREFTRQAR